jgi:hypothetical protein
LDSTRESRIYAPSREKGVNKFLKKSLGVAPRLSLWLW